MDPNPKSRKTRHRSPKHPGVSIEELNDSQLCRYPAGHAKAGQWNGRSWRLRWRTGKRGRSMAVHDRSRTDVERVAIQQSRQLTNARAEEETRRFDALKAGRDPDADAPADSAARHTLEAACRRHYQYIAVDQKRARSTCRNVARGLKSFLQWCGAHGVQYLDELTADVMQAWNSYERTRDMAHARDDRTAYKTDSVNQMLKPVRAMLRREIGLERVPRLNELKLRITIPHIPCRTDTQRETHEVQSAWRLEVEDARALLRAALKYDAHHASTGWLVPPIASDLAILILFGPRRGEYVATKCGHVKLDKKGGGWYLHIVKGKGRRKREIWCDRYTAVGREILLAQRGKRDESEWLSHNTYYQLADAIKRLHSDGWGGPDVTSHDLRATCATYQTAIAGYQPQHGVRRMGHLLSENDLTYVASHMPEDIVMEADSIEHAMGCVAEFQAVLASMAHHPAAPRPSRDNVVSISTRVRSESTGGECFLAKDKHAVRDAIARMTPIAVA